MAKVIWSSAGSPTSYVSRTLGIEQWKVGKAIHIIKAKANLGGADNVIIFDDGTVTDRAGIEIGNIHDEV